MLKLDIQFFALEIGDTEVTYTKNYLGEDVTSVQVDVRIPATDGEKTGYITLGKIEGWTLSEGNTKLTKVYSENATEIIDITMVEFNGTVFEEVSTSQSIEVYEINANTRTSVTVDYTMETDGKIHRFVESNIIVTLKESFATSYQLSESNIGWTVSEDKTSMTKTMDANRNVTETIFLFPTGEADSVETIISDEIGYKVEKIGLTIEEPIVTYIKENYDEDVIGAKVNILVPYTLEEKSGYATIGNVLGWKLTEEYTKLSRSYQDNIDETITIPITEASGYNFTSLNISCNIVVDYIDYRRIVKGRCPSTKCFYDVYTKAEIENYKLKLEEKLSATGNPYTAPLYEMIGEIEELTTENKESLVKAVNEVNENITELIEGLGKTWEYDLETVSSVSADAWGGIASDFTTDILPAGKYLVSFSGSIIGSSSGVSTLNPYVDGERLGVDTRHTVPVASPVQSTASSLVYLEFTDEITHTINIYNYSNVAVQPKDAKVTFIKIK